MSIYTVADELVEVAEKADQSQDDTWSNNDWIAFVNAYIGRAASGVRRNERENQTFRENMVKAGGLILSAIAAHDNRAG